jgi:hypothetical protein
LSYICQSENLASAWHSFAQSDNSTSTHLNLVFTKPNAMKRLFTLFFFLLHLVCSGQILNASFENWTLLPDADITEQQWTLDNWQHLTPLGDSILSLNGTYRDSTAKTGNFALGLSRWYSYTFDMALFRGACSAKPKRA